MSAPDPVSDPVSDSVSDATDRAEPLPVHLTGFVGRARELDQLERLLHSTRLLTLTGAGGSGKTRLAREAALAALSHFDRVAWVDLAPLDDGDLVASEVARALDVAEHASVPTTKRIVSVIGDESALLVLDNCEHLIEASAQLTNELLTGCRHLTVLATSREALGVIGETAWLVPRLDDAEASLLFAERARAAQPSFVISDANRDAVEKICARLDGIPLAIELAAARVKVLSPKQIAARLDDVFSLLTVSSRTALPRHRTLRNTMEWSYALLSSREQALLRRLAVFAGSFSLEAAEAVCADPSDAHARAGDASLEPHDVLDGVAALVDKSLVVMEPGEEVSRYRLLETVRQYGMERLVEAGERELLQERHATHYLAFAESFAPLLVGGEQVPGLLARVTRENDNLRVAAQWAAADPSRAVQALQFADALFWYWYGTGYWLRTGQFNEARDYVAEAIARGGDAPPSLRGRVLIAQGLTRLAQGDWANARDSFANALEYLRVESDPASMAIALSKKSAAHLMLGDLDDARRLTAQAREWARDVPLGMVHAFVIYWQGFIELHDRDIEAMRISRAEAIRVSRSMEQHRTIRAHQSSLMARGEMLMGHLDEAASLLRDAWTLHEIVGDGWGLAHDLEALSMYLAHRSRIDDGVRVMGAADALHARIATAMLGVDEADRARRVGEARAALGPDFDRLYAEGEALESTALSALVIELTSTTNESAPRMDEAKSVDTTDSPLATASPAATDVAPSLLQVRALGPLEVLVNDVLVDAGAWGSARPKELLVFLMLHPEGSTKEQVGLALWPDASASQLRNSFHVTTYRLRKALGRTDWIQLRGERYVVDPRLVKEFDVHEFEREVADARAALAHRDEQAIESLERTLTRYRGELLDGEPVSDWHLEPRERLQRLYVDALADIAAFYEGTQRDERAADAYARLLARDPLHEGAIRSVMRVHARLGDRAQAARVFQRFSERLQRELAIAPDTETSQLAARIAQGGDA